MVTKMKLALTNVPFTQILACIIKNWLRFKSVAIAVRLAYIS